VGPRGKPPQSQFRNRTEIELGKSPKQLSAAHAIGKFGGCCFITGMVTSQLLPSAHATRKVQVSSQLDLQGASLFRRSKILIVEDHPLVREGIQALLRQQPDLQCCGEAESIFTALTYVALQQPDLVLLDLRLQDGDAFGLIRVLTLKYPSLRILVVSQCEEKVYGDKSVAAGARGFLMKQNAPMELANAIRTVLAGKIYRSAELRGEPA
jgi:CheY-like chemotaxis protein